MGNDRRIDEWRRHARKQPPGIHGYFDMKDGLSVWFRRDKLGRARIMEDTRTIVTDGLSALLTPPGLRPRPPHPVYVYGYERAVAYEYGLLTGELFFPFGSRPWHKEGMALAGDLTVPGGPYDPYGPWVAYCQTIEKAVAAARPALIAALEPIARRHGLDVVPWGIGWMLEMFVAVQPYGPDPEPVEGPPRGQRDPATDALLLYVHLAGYRRDKRAHEIIKPVIDLDEVADPLRRIQAIKRALGAHRKSGRPPTPDAEAADEVYELLKRQVRYLTSQGRGRGASASDSSVLRGSV